MCKNLVRVASLTNGTRLVQECEENRTDFFLASRSASWSRIRAREIGSSDIIWFCYG